MSDRKKRISAGLISGIFFSVLIHFATKAGSGSLGLVLDRYELQSFDSRMQARVRNVEEASIDSIVIIDIEQNSVENLGNYHEWPHAYHGQLIDVVTAGDPKAIIFDIIFDKKDDGRYKLVESLSLGQSNLTPEVKSAAERFLVSHDPNRFVWSTSKSPVLHHALVFEPEDTLNFLYAMDHLPPGYEASDHTIKVSEDVSKRLPEADRLGNTYVELLAGSKGAGAANFPQDQDGIIRKAPTAIHFKGSGLTFLSLTLSAVKNILGIPPDGFIYDFERGLLELRDTTGTIVREIPIDEMGRMYVNYYGPFKTFYYIPYMYCFDPEMLDPSYWQGKVAIVGSSLPGLMDLRNTPVQESFAGVEIHANVAHSILQNQFISDAKGKSKLLAIILLSIFVGALSGYPTKPFWGFGVLAIGLTTWVIFVYGQFLNHQIVWDIVRPTIAMALTQLSVFSYTFLILDKDKRFLRETFGTYISPQLIDKMIEEKTEPQLGGQEGRHTAFFSDIEGFAEISEKLRAADLVHLLNQYLSDMTKILLKNQGTLDKYIGDAIVAFYGAPIPVEDHEFKACVTALAIQAQQVKLRKGWKNELGKWPESVHQMNTRIGLHTGTLVTGNMGSKQRMNYTMIGDTVNLAARLESSAKQYGVYTQISENTYQAVRERVVVRELDYVRVVGKEIPVKTYELISLAGQEDEVYKTLIPKFHKGLDEFRNQNFSKAKDVFKETEKLERSYHGRKKNPSSNYIIRCESFLKAPPGPNWDGVWSLTSKK